jgi:RNA polymerase sigma factor (sigma-70 family)
VQRTCLKLARDVGLIANDDEALERVLAARQESELRLDLAAAFEALPPSYREVAIMRDLHEMTIDEIGAALGLSRQAVKARLHRARLLLREYLAR